MSVTGDWKSAVITVATNATETVEADLGRAYDLMQIDMPTLAVSCSLSVKVSKTTGGAFKSLGNSVASNVGTGNIQDVFKIYGHRYIKLVSSQTQTGTTHTFNVRGIGL